MTGGVIFPELVRGRDDDDSSLPWTVLEGSVDRGSASCNLSDRVLEVPFAMSAQARVVRAHELVHARVSPHVRHLVKALDDVSPRALECAEELRVNTLLQRLRFDVAILRDGTEKIGGRRLAEEASWAEAICFLMAVLGTGAEKDYFAGIRQGRATWLPALRILRKRALSIFDQLSTDALGATRLNDEGLPSGYAISTLLLARLVTQTMAARVPTSPEELRALRRSLEPGGRRLATGHFAPLVFCDSREDTQRPRASLTRRDRATATGTVMRYPSRWVSDDQRRAFSERGRRHGGVVVLDLSGSMDVATDELAELLRVAPAALVVGYSHRPGDTGKTPNAWVLARRGRVVGNHPSSNVGNGVDGPVLRWALGQRHALEPLVWVTDGQVTDSHDYPDDSLTAECAILVRRHRIRLARDIGEARTLLRSNCATPASRWPEFGRVGRKLRESAAI